MKNNQRAGIVKHKKVFEQWLDGKEIEYRLNDNDTWASTGGVVNWYVSSQYRAKHEKLTKNEVKQLLLYNTESTVIDIIFERGITNG